MARQKDEDEPPSPETTMVRKGKEAFLLAEMGTFMKELQARPLAKLLEDLPGLLALPAAKYALVAIALGKRMRTSETDRTYIQMQLENVRAEAAPELRERCDALLKPIE